MNETRFTNREIELLFSRVDEKFDEMSEKLDEHAKTHGKILEQVLYTNGKVKKITLWLVIIGTATGTVLVTNGSEFLDFVLRII